MKQCDLCIRKGNTIQLQKPVSRSVGAYSIFLSLQASRARRTLSRRLTAFCAALCLLLFFNGQKCLHAGEHPLQQLQIVGTPRKHTITRGETLLDIARAYDLGINEIQALYPHLDPWIPPEGMELALPSRWILPRARTKGIVINLAELRLYFFRGKNDPVVSFPIAAGDQAFKTPIGDFRIGEKRTQPTWFIPSSLQEKYGVASIPPGPDNPLGNYWLGLANTSYGIHGTDIPWSVGRLTTHGCIRLYPEDIERLFALTEIGTQVTIIYEPVKICLVSGRVFAEVHADIYGRINDFVEYGRLRVREEGVAERVDLEKFGRVLASRDGMVVEITRSAPVE